MMSYKFTLPEQQVALFPVTLLWIVFLFLAVAGCDEKSDGAPELFLNYTPATYSIEIAVDSTDNQHVVSCTDFLKIFRVKDGVREEIESASMYPLDAWEGYFLDNELVYPVSGMGCDVLSCERLGGEWFSEFSRKLVEYQLVGTRTLTDEEKAAIPDYYTVGDTLNEYISTPIQGPVEVTLTYAPDEDCHNEAHLEKLTVPFVIQ